MDPQGAYGASGSIPLVNPKITSAMSLHYISSMCNAVVVGYYRECNMWTSCSVM